MIWQQSCVNWSAVPLPTERTYISKYLWRHPSLSFLSSSSLSPPMSSLWSWSAKFFCVCLELNSHRYETHNIHSHTHPIYLSSVYLQAEIRTRTLPLPYTCSWTHRYHKCISLHTHTHSEDPTRCWEKMGDSHKEPMRPSTQPCWWMSRLGPSLPLSSSTNGLARTCWLCYIRSILGGFAFTIMWRDPGYQMERLSDVMPDSLYSITVSSSIV